MRKGLYSLLAAALVLALVFGLLRLRERAVLAPPGPFADMDPSAVTELRVAYAGDSVELHRGPRGWVVAEDGFPADTARLARVLENLRGLRDRERVSADTAPARLAEYGLDSATARRVSWTLADGRVARIALGKVSGIDYGSSFWRPAGAEESYRTPGAFAYEVSARAKDWKDTNLFAPFTPRDIRAVAVEWSEADGARHAWTLARADEAGDSVGAYGLEAPGLPEGTPASPVAAARIFRHAAQFKVDGFLSGPDTSAARAGLEHPVMTVRIRLRDGREHVVTAGNPVDGLYRYVRHPRHVAPVRVFLWRFEYFAKKAEDLAEGR